MVIVGDLDTPAWQWTSTLPPLFRAASVREKKEILNNELSITTQKPNRRKQTDKVDGLTKVLLDILGTTVRGRQPQSAEGPWSLELAEEGDGRGHVEDVRYPRPFQVCHVGRILLVSKTEMRKDLRHDCAVDGSVDVRGRGTEQQRALLNDHGLAAQVRVVYHEVLQATCRNF